MDINPDNLAILNTGFRANFQGAFEGATSVYEQIATPVPSTGKSNDYGWLGKFPKMREWIGERHYNRLSKSGYRIENKPFELTVVVDRDDIDDDEYGIYKPMFEEMGRETKTFPDELIFSLAKAGQSTKCFDGQFFFDTDHEIAGKSVSNWGGGTGPLWMLLCTTRALKPFIYQTRRPFEMVSKTSLTDDRVFDRKEFVWGVDGRCNVGYGFWQMAFASREPFTDETYAEARAYMGNLTNDAGKPLGLMPDLVVAGTALEGDLLEVLNSERNAAGATNKWRGTAKALITPWMAEAA